MADTCMLSKCANPKCTALFRYLHIGKLFRMEVPAVFATVKATPEYAKKTTVAHRILLVV
jgi:hypothetical protein